MLLLVSMQKKGFTVFCCWSFCAVPVGEQVMYKLICKLICEMKDKVNMQIQV